MGNTASSTEVSSPRNLHHNTSSSFRSKSKLRPAFIADNFSSLEEVTTALRGAGLESSNLILGIDFTKSNSWTGRYSFDRKSLHDIGTTFNPYEQAISIIGRTLSPFDEDNLIPCFGFGDASTRDECIFSFYSDHHPCHGFEEVLSRYREIVPYISLSGPTSFGPLILAAIDLVVRNNGQYHILVIIADGQVSGSATPGYPSRQEKQTIDAIVKASYYPLSIIMVGVGDGPWDAMQQFDDYVPQRSFDNFQFVNFTNIMSKNMTIEMKETTFALSALMEIPFQYRATQSMLNIEKHKMVGSVEPLGPPREVVSHDKAMRSIGGTESVSSSDIPTEKACPICLTNPRDMAFNCGHLTCRSCGVTVSTCPLCRTAVTTRMKIYS